MEWVFGVPVAVGTVTLIVLGLTGRFRPRNCCPADPALDRRMAAAFEADSQGVGGVDQ